jgi:small GTP-binding protein
MIPSNSKVAVYKIVLLGNTRSGKTSILARQLTNGPIDNLNATIGVNCQEIELDVEGHPITLNIWDTAGQELYYSVVPIYIRGASGALLVCDISDRSSFVRLEWWFAMVSEHAGATIPVFVVANKVDLADKRIVMDDELEVFAENHSAKLFRTSALTGKGIGELFQAIAGTMAENKKTNETQDGSLNLVAKKKCC